MAPVASAELMWLHPDEDRQDAIKFDLNRAKPARNFLPATAAMLLGTAAMLLRAAAMLLGTAAMLLRAASVAV